MKRLFPKGPLHSDWILAVCLICSLTAAICRAEMVVIQEIMYHPPGQKPEYIILQNNTATPFDIADWRITDGVAFAFRGFSSKAPEEPFLKAFEGIVISSRDASATRAAYDFPPSLRIFGPWSGKLDNAGERITVEDKNGVVVSTVKYGTRGRWSPAADGAGHSLVLKNPNGRIDDWHNWGSSAVPRLGAGKDAIALGSSVNRSARSLRLNEIHFQGSNLVNWVELFNPIDDPVSAAGLYLSGRRDLSDKVPLAGELTARSHRSWEVNFPLKHGQITIYLMNADDTVLDCGVFLPPRLAECVQAFPDGTSEWYASKESSGNAVNNPLRQTNVVINEIMYDPPASASKGEFVELFNRGLAEADLTGWEFQEGIGFKFPVGTKIPAGGFLVVAKDVEWMRALYGEIPVVGNFERKLSQAGELIRLVDQLGNLVNEVDYKSGGDWPALARGDGSSMELIHPRMDNRLASAWRDSDESQKAPWQAYSSTNTYLESKVVGEPSDYRELHLHLVGEGHVAINKINLLKDGTNYVVNGTRLSTNGSSEGGWLCQGTHWASFITNGQLHIVSDGRGDNKPNRVEIDLPGIKPNETYELKFDARWISGKPRLIAQTWDQSIAQSLLLQVPKNLGTPGKANSRSAPTPAPQLDALWHNPAVPRSTNSVKITAKVFCAGPLADVQLFHRADSPEGTGAWSSQPMFDDGMRGGDAAARDGIFTGEINQYKKPGQVVQFYVQAVTQDGQVAVLPNSGDAKPALYVVDNRALPRELRTVRLVVSAHDLGAIVEGNGPKYGFRFPRLSNHYFNATFISNEEEIFYGGEIRNTGSPLTRNGELHKVKFKLPADRPFRDRTRFGFDDDAAEGKAYHNRVVCYLLYLLGHPANQNEFVRLVINAGEVQTREDTELVDNNFLDRNFPGGSAGDLYRIDDQWWFLDDWEGVQRDADWSYKNSDNPGHYRAEWMKRTNETEDDYSRLIDFFKTISQTNSTLEEIDRLLDPQATLKLAAVRGYIGDWDNFTMQRGRNGYMYRRPTDGRFQFLHWDSDEGFLTGQPLYGERIKPWLERPRNQRLFQDYLKELLRHCVEEPSRLRAWLEIENEASRGCVPQAAYLNFFKIRGAEVRQMMDKADQLQSRIIPNEGSPQTTTVNAASRTAAAP